MKPENVVKPWPLWRCARQPCDLPVVILRPRSEEFQCFSRSRGKVAGFCHEILKYKVEVADSNHKVIFLSGDEFDADDFAEDSGLSKHFILLSRWKLLVANLLLERGPDPYGVSMSDAGDSLGAMTDTDDLAEDDLEFGGPVPQSPNSEDLGASALGEQVETRVASSLEACPCTSPCFQHFSAAGCKKKGRCKFCHNESHRAGVKDKRKDRK